VKRVGKVDGLDADKTELIKLKFFMDPDNLTLVSKETGNFAISKDGCPEEWICSISKG
jgi:hypothetical protein